MIIGGHRVKVALRLHTVLGIRGVHVDRRCLRKGAIDLLRDLGARTIRRRGAIGVILNVHQGGVHERIVHARDITSLARVSRHKRPALKGLLHRGRLGKHIVQDNGHHGHQRNGSQLVGLSCGCQEHDAELNRKPKDCVQSGSHTHIGQRNKGGPVGGCEQACRILKPEHLVHLLVVSPEFFSRTFFCRRANIR
jgi:hypothetical protein